MFGLSPLVAGLSPTQGRRSRRFAGLRQRAILGVVALVARPRPERIGVPSPCGGMGTCFGTAKHATPLPSRRYPLGVAGRCCGNWRGYRIGVLVPASLSFVTQNQCLAPHFRLRPRAPSTLQALPHTGPRCPARSVVGRPASHTGSHAAGAGRSRYAHELRAKSSANAGNSDESARLPARTRRFLREIRACGTYRRICKRLSSIFGPSDLRLPGPGWAPEHAWTLSPDRFADCLDRLACSRAIRPQPTERMHRLGEAS